MTALFQNANSSTKHIIPHYDTKGGNSVGLPFTKQIENSADMLAFLASQVFPAAL